MNMAHHGPGSKRPSGGYWDANQAAPMGDRLLLAAVFDDLYNLVHDPSFLVVAWGPVRANGAPDQRALTGSSRRAIADPGAWLTELQEDLKARLFQPDPVRERMIPKRNGNCGGLVSRPR